MARIGVGAFRFLANNAGSSLAAVAGIVSVASLIALSGINSIEKGAVASSNLARLVHIQSLKNMLQSAGGCALKNKAAGVTDVSQICSAGGVELLELGEKLELMDLGEIEKDGYLGHDLYLRQLRLVKHPSRDCIVPGYCGRVDNLDSSEKRQGQMWLNLVVVVQGGEKSSVSYPIEIPMVARVEQDTAGGNFKIKECSTGFETAACTQMGGLFVYSGGKWSCSLAPVAASSPAGLPSYGGTYTERTLPGSTETSCYVKNPLLLPQQYRRKKGFDPDGDGPMRAPTDNKMAGCECPCGYEPSPMLTLVPAKSYISRTYSCYAKKSNASRSLAAVADEVGSCTAGPAASNSSCGVTWDPPEGCQENEVNICQLWWDRGCGADDNDDGNLEFMNSSGCAALETSSAFKECCIPPCPCMKKLDDAAGECKDDREQIEYKNECIAPSPSDSALVGTWSDEDCECTCPDNSQWIYEGDGCCKDEYVAQVSPTDSTKICCNAPSVEVPSSSGGGGGGPQTTVTKYALCSNLTCNATRSRATCQMNPTTGLSDLEKAAAPGQRQFGSADDDATLNCDTLCTKHLNEEINNNNAVSQSIASGCVDDGIGSGDCWCKKDVAVNTPNNSDDGANTCSLTSHIKLCPCSAGEVKEAQCRSPNNWTETANQCGTCACSTDPCPGGGTRNATTCECPCPDGQIMNNERNRCECWDGSTSTPCPCNSCRQCCDTSTTPSTAKTDDDCPKKNAGQRLNAKEGVWNADCKCTCPSTACCYFTTESTCSATSPRCKWEAGECIQGDDAPDTFEWYSCTGTGQCLPIGGTYGDDKKTLTTTSGMTNKKLVTENSTVNICVSGSLSGDASSQSKTMFVGVVAKQGDNILDTGLTYEAKWRLVSTPYAEVGQAFQPIPWFTGHNWMHYFCTGDTMTEYRDSRNNACDKPYQLISNREGLYEVKFTATHTASGASDTRTFKFKCSDNRPAPACRYNSCTVPNCTEQCDSRCNSDTTFDDDIFSDGDGDDYDCHAKCMENCQANSSCVCTGNNRCSVTSKRCVFPRPNATPEWGQLTLPLAGIMCTFNSPTAACNETRPCASGQTRVTNGTCCDSVKVYTDNDTQKCCHSTPVGNVCPPCSSGQVSCSSCTLSQTCNDPNDDGCGICETPSSPPVCPADTVLCDTCTSCNSDTNGDGCCEECTLSCGQKNDADGTCENVTTLPTPLPTSRGACIDDGGFWDQTETPPICITKDAATTKANDDTNITMVSTGRGAARACHLTTCVASSLCSITTSQTDCNNACPGADSNNKGWWFPGLTTPIQCSTSCPPNTKLDGDERCWMLDESECTTADHSSLSWMGNGKCCSTEATSQGVCEAGGGTWTSDTTMRSSCPALTDQSMVQGTCSCSSCPVGEVACSTCTSSQTCNDPNNDDCGTCSSSPPPPNDGVCPPAARTAYDNCTDAITTNNTTCTDYSTALDRCNTSLPAACSDVKNSVSWIDSDCCRSPYDGLGSPGACISAATNCSQCSNDYLCCNGNRLGLHTPD